MIFSYFVNVIGTFKKNSKVPIPCYRNNLIGTRIFAALEVPINGNFLYKYKL